MHAVVICFALLTIFAMSECTIVNIICEVNEDNIFEGAESVPAEYVQFRLYTRNNSENFILLTHEENIRQSTYNPYSQTIFIIHGYQSSPGSPDLISLKQFILMHDDVNVVMVDWSSGASEPYMPFAIRNTVATAREVAYFIQLLMKVSGTDLSRIHLIGNSLGGQLVSFVGKRFDKIGRITALDPAGPCFSLYGKDHRIHYTDAEFVDVIITNADGFGLKQPSGHVNFVVNGGVTQPGCGAVVLKNFRSHNFEALFLDNCSHRRALEYYIDSLMNKCCPFVGYSCSNYEDFLDGKCTDCGEDGRKCAPLGYKAIEYKSKIQKETKVFYLKTASKSLYCLYHYAVFLKLSYSEDSINEIGQLYITLEGNNYETQKLLTPRSQSFVAGKEYSYLLTLPIDVGHLKSVILLWIRTSGGPYSSHKLYIDSIKISLMNGKKNNTSTVFKQCQTDALKSGVQLRYFVETHRCQ
uniref:Phospholipase A1 n=1 Tax=Hadrurus spadix TaxID=141984 RepID=A0A1W7R9Z3_9SCOR